MLPNRTELRPLLLLALAVLSLCTSPSARAQKTVPRSKSASPLSTAKAQLARGDLNSVESTLWGILASEPANEQALLMLGVVRGRQQRYAEAEALFRRVLQLNPKSIVASRNLAGALLAQDKPDDAIRQYNQAIQLNPDSVSARALRGSTLLEAGRPQEAILDLKTARALDPNPQRDTRNTTYLLGRAYIALGKRDEAKALFAQLGPQFSSNKTDTLNQLSEQKRRVALHPQAKRIQ